MWYLLHVSCCESRIYIYDVMYDTVDTCMYRQETKVFTNMKFSFEELVFKKKLP